MQHGLGVSAFVLALASGGLLIANSANAIALPPWARTMMGGLLVLSIAIFGLYMFSMSAFGSALRPDPARVAEVRKSQFVGQVTLAYGLQDWMRRGGSQAKVQVYAEGLVIELSSFEPFALCRNEGRSMRETSEAGWSLIEIEHSSTQVPSPIFLQNAHGIQEQVSALLARR